MDTFSRKTDKPEPVVKVPEKQPDPEKQCQTCGLFQFHSGSKCYGECSDPRHPRTVGAISTCPAWTAR